MGSEGEHREMMEEEPHEMNSKVNICLSGNQIFYTLQK